MQSVKLPISVRIQDIDGWPEAALPPLDHASAHLWTGPLDVPESRRRALADTLSDDERARRARFVTQTLRDRYAVGRGLLRRLLAGYTGGAPEEVRFRYGHAGKPELEAPAVGLHFNIAHSDAHIALLVSRAGPVGVDIEVVKPFSGMREIARDRFEAEVAELVCALSDDALPDAFYRAWTRYEAGIKAAGLGLGAPVASAPAGMHVLDLPLASGLMLAIAVPDTVEQVSMVRVR